MPVSAEARWLEMRALYEVEGVSCARLATVAALTERGVEQRATRQGWLPPQQRATADLERIRALQAIAMSEVDAAMAVGDGEAFDKGRIETAASALKVIEKLLDTTRASLLAQQHAERTHQAGRDDAEYSGKEQEERDAEIAEIAEILESIEGQIDRLARDYATELAGDQGGRQEGRTGRQ